jgi:hypothetical protein
MSYDAKTLLRLLPAIYQTRDGELAGTLAGLLTQVEVSRLAQLEANQPAPGTDQWLEREALREKSRRGPLESLLAVIAEQLAVLDEDLAQSYDDHFIETCADWAVPYLGDLIGYRALHGDVPEVASPRAEVAHTIAYRRRKGTASMLEQLARDVTGWEAAVVEYFDRLAATQYLNHLRPHVAAADLRQAEALERLGGAFDRTPHTVDVRSISRCRGRYNIPNVAIYLWPLSAHGLTRSPAVQAGVRRYRFSPLGHDLPLVTLPEVESEIAHLAEPINVPEPVGRGQLDRRLPSYYGEGRSLSIAVEANDVPVEEILIADLSDDAAGWAHAPHPTKYLVDPELGRLALPDTAVDPAPVRVTFHYGFGAELGGGEYARPASPDPLPPDLQVVQVPKDQPTISAALRVLKGAGVVEIGGSGRYAEGPPIVVNAGAIIVIRARDGCRPTLVLNGELSLRGGEDASVVLDGLLVCGNRLRVPADQQNALSQVSLRHTTLVPGWSLRVDGSPAQPTEPSLVIDLSGTNVRVERSIVGGIRAAMSAGVVLRDSFLDATDPAEVAFAALDHQSAGGQLSVDAVTIIGRVHTDLLQASDSIFLAKGEGAEPWLTAVKCRRCQEGCMRFSYVPRDARVPRRYHCQPLDGGAELAPVLHSRHYGNAAYGRLGPRTPDAILRGAHDEGEMGAFHHVYRPQREANVRLRLDEYLRVGLEAGIFYA